MFQYKKFLFVSVLVAVIHQSSQSPVGNSDSVDLNVDISCVANASCITNVSNKVVRALNLKKMIDFGAFTIEPVKNAKKVEGRSMSKLSEIINGNALRVPLGSYSLSLQKSEEYDNYLEVTVSKTIEGEEKTRRKIIPEKISFTREGLIRTRLSIHFTSFERFSRSRTSGEEDNAVLRSGLLGRLAGRLVDVGPGRCCSPLHQGLPGLKTRSCHRRRHDPEEALRAPSRVNLFQSR